MNFYEKEHGVLTIPTFTYKQHNDRSWSLTIKYGDDPHCNGGWFHHRNKRKSALEKIERDRYPARYVILKSTWYDSDVAH